MIQALFVLPRPATTRQAVLLIERLAHEQGRSLWLARRTKEALASGKELSDTEREELRVSSSYEFYGFTAERADSWESRVQLERLIHTYIAAHTPAGKEPPVFSVPWRPGLPITSTNSSAQEIDLDDPSFDPISLLG